MWLTDRRWRRWTEPQDDYFGLSRAEFERLARYNAEVGRGLMHTPEWKVQMAALQEQYDAGKQA